MKDKKEFLLDTDIIIDFLTVNDNKKMTVLEIAMSKGICFTTVLNASELFFAVKDETEKEKVKKVISSLKVLGVNARYSLNISDFFNKVATVRDAILCSIAKNNGLPILTNNIDRYKNSGIEIIESRKLEDAWYSEK